MTNIATKGQRTMATVKMLHSVWQRTTNVHTEQHDQIVETCQSGVKIKMVA